MSNEMYIWIPNWDGPEGFQHYQSRDPIWIKNYTRLLSHDAYSGLSYHQRGILHGIWMEYARSGRRLPVNTPTTRRQHAHTTSDNSVTAQRQLSDNAVTLSRRLGHKVSARDLKALNHAGFIELIASDVLAERLQLASNLLASRAPARSREKRREQDLYIPRGVREGSKAARAHKADDDWLATREHEPTTDEEDEMNRPRITHTQDPTPGLRAMP